MTEPQSRDSYPSLHNNAAQREYVFLSKHFQPAGWKLRGWPSDGNTQEGQDNAKEIFI